MQPSKLLIELFATATGVPDKKSSVAFEPKHHLLCSFWLYVCSDKRQKKNKKNLIGIILGCNFLFMRSKTKVPKKPEKKTAG
jgi:hypothetical protein